MAKPQVHIIFRKISGWEYSGHEFIAVFFDRKSAEEWIDTHAGRRREYYSIETHYTQDLEYSKHLGNTLESLYERTSTT